MFGAAPTIFFLRRDGFEVYTSPAEGPVPFISPPAASQNLEILDRAAMEAAIQAFFTEHPPVSNRFIFILSEELLFHKIFEEKDSAKQTVMEKQFLDEVPIDPKYLAHGKWMSGDQLHCFAVNKQFYILLRSFLLTMKDEKNKSKNNIVVAVLPSFLFGQIEAPQSILGQQAGLTAEAFSAINGFGRFKSLDLLLQEPKPTPMGPPKLEMKGSKQSNILAAVAFAVFFIVIIGGVVLLLKTQADEVRNATIKAKQAKEQQEKQAAEESAAAAAAQQPAPPAPQPITVSPSPQSPKAK